MARLMGEPVSLKTSSGRAKDVIEVPKFEIDCPVKNFQKSQLIGLFIEVLA